MPKRLVHKGGCRPLWFRFEPLPARTCGWREERQFGIGTLLYVTGSGHIGGPMDDFRKVTLPELDRRFENDLVQPVTYRGRRWAIRRKPHNSALFRLPRRTGGACDPHPE